ncbi:hypothetical protein AB0K90_31135, partial [Streptomyces syringium]
MRSVLPTRLLRVKAVVATLAAALLLWGAPSVRAEGVSGPPKMSDGFGLTQAGGATGSATNFVVTVNTPQVAGAHRIRILLPRDYAADPDKRYPVLYFLHGASDDPGNPNLAYPALAAA